MTLVNARSTTSALISFVPMTHSALSCVSLKILKLWLNFPGGRTIPDLPYYNTFTTSAVLIFANIDESTKPNEVSRSSDQSRRRMGRNFSNVLLWIIGLAGLTALQGATRSTPLHLNLGQTDVDIWKLSSIRADRPNTTPSTSKQKNKSSGISPQTPI